MAGLQYGGRAYFPRGAENAVLERCSLEGNLIGYKSGRTGFFLQRTYPKAALAGAMQENAVDAVYVFLDKYQWREFQRHEDVVVEVRSGKKPKYLVNHLVEN